MRRVGCGFLSIVLLCLLLASGVEAETEVYHSVPTDGMRIALTFDDGPHPTLTPRILEILARYGVSATFFMVGKNVINYPSAARAVLDAGHEVGNHTYSHGHVATLDRATLGDEIGLCEDTLEELFEYRPHLFRPPEGALTEQVIRCSEDGDYTLILWSLDTRDWENKNADEIVRTVMERIKPGDIILMHDYIGYQSKTPEALERLLPELLRRGFEPVTVSCLLGERSA